MNDARTSNEQLPTPWRVTSRNVPIADTGDYDGVLEIRAANGALVVDFWNPSDGIEEAFARIVNAMNDPRDLIAACSPSADALAEAYKRWPDPHDRWLGNTRYGFLEGVRWARATAETRAEPAAVPYLDSVRLEWLFRHISGAEWRRLGITTSAGMNRTLLNDAMVAAESAAPHSCRCPAGPGEDCPLTLSECYARERLRASEKTGASLQQDIAAEFDGPDDENARRMP